LDYVVLTILLVILAIIFSAIALILLVPFGITLQFARTGTSTTGQIAISWFWITVIRRRMPREKKKEEEEKKPKAAKEEQKKKRKFDWKQTTRILSALRDSPQYLPLILDAFRKSIKIKRVSASLTFGIEDDPAETATVCGYLWSLALVVNALPRSSLMVYPSFEGERLDGSIAAELRVRLLRIVVAFIRSYFKKPFRDLVSTIRRRT